MRYPEPSELLDQLAYLVDELRLMAPLMVRVPRPLLEARPMLDTPSILETLGSRITAEEALIQELEKHPSKPPSNLSVSATSEASWNRFPVDELLYRLQEARQRTVSLLEEVPVELWEPEKETGSLAAFVYAWIQEDVHALRYIGERLRESQLTLRPPSPL